MAGPARRDGLLRHLDRRRRDGRCVGHGATPTGRAPRPSSICTLRDLRIERSHHEPHGGDQCDGEHDHGDEHDGHRRPERLVLRRLELAGHQRPDHVAGGAAEDRGGDVVAGEGDEHQEQPGGDAGGRERQRDLAERLPPAGAQVLACLAERGIEAIEGHEQREDHERQVVVDHADLHRLARVEHRQRAAEDVGRLQPLRDEASRRQHDAPGHRPDEEARPERDDHQAEGHAAPLRADLHGHPVGEGEADEQAEQRSR